MKKTGVWSVVSQASIVVWTDDASIRAIVPSRKDKGDIVQKVEDVRAHL